MCDQARLELPSAARAAGEARRFLAAQCGRWGLEALCDDVVLTVSELVTNAVVHAGSSAGVTVSLAGDFLEVAVRDDSPRVPILRPVRLDLEADIDVVIARPQQDGNERGPFWHVGEAGSIAAGRGMLIVDAIADEWGVSHRAGGKEVWFRFRTPATDERGCTCPGSHVHTPGGLPLRVATPAPPAPP
jgi:anti-sigma regulatory factor (Ser/Thr protein kinase)